MVIVSNMHSWLNLHTCCLFCARSNKGLRAYMNPYLLTLYMCFPFCACSNQGPRVYMTAQGGTVTLSQTPSMPYGMLDEVVVRDVAGHNTVRCCFIFSSLFR